MKEWHSSFPCNSFCKECFSCSWRTHEEYSFWNFCSHVCKFLWIFQKINDFFKFFFCFYGSCNIFECLFFFIIWFCLSCATLTKTHSFVVHPTYLACHKDE